MQIIQSRRSFLTGLTGIAAGLIASPALAEPPPEVTQIRLVRIIRRSGTDRAIHYSTTTFSTTRGASGSPEMRLQSRISRRCALP